MKTGTQIQSDIIDLLKGSPLLAALSGGMYRGGMRPRGSKKEDLMVIFTTALGGQLQQGDVTLNIYVPDIPVGKDGVLYQNSARCEEIERLALEEIETWNVRSAYRFTLRATISSDHDDDINQSFVVVRLGFRVLDV